MCGVSDMSAKTIADLPPGKKIMATREDLTRQIRSLYADVLFFMRGG
jgi:hypothetical protein